MDSTELEQLKSGVILSDVVRPYISKGLKKSGGEMMGLCPFHNDRSPSFYVNDDKGLYYCHGCSAAGNVFKFLQDKLHVDFTVALSIVKNTVGDYTNIQPRENSVEIPIIPIPTTDNSYQFKYGYSAIYHYRNKDGELLYKVARYEATDINPKKRFYPATHTEEGWKPKAPTEGRVLYNIGSLVHPGMGIIVEGEKCVNTGSKVLLSRAIVTWMGGWGTAGMTDMVPLQDGRKWVLWMDNDQGGIETAHYLGSIIENLYIIPIPEGKPKGWDIADAIDEGWGIEEISAFINTKITYSEWVASVTNHDDVQVSNKEEIVIQKVSDVTSCDKYHLPNKLHGLCGDIEEWINATAYKKQPLLAINAALAFVGALKGQRVCTERNLLTNIYALSLGESGCGKDHPRQCLEVLANEVGLQDRMMAGVPASGTALVKSVKRAGRCLIQIDELGRVIGNINGKNAGGFQREIVDNMMMLYSSASTLFREKEYAAGREEQEKNAIVKPCLCIHAMTVPERFYNNLTTDDVIDGFLSRWMIIASDNPDPDESEVETNIEDIPQNIIDRVNDIQNMSTNVKISELPTSETQIQKIQNAINPKVILCTKEAKHILNQYKSIARQLKNDLRTSGSPLDALWVRMGENAHKIALIVQDGDYITATDMNWACDWVMYWTQYSIDQVKDRLSDNEQDKRTKDIFNMIKKNPGITKSQITKVTFAYGKRLREEIIETLIESEKIFSEKVETSTKPFLKYFPC